MLKHQGQSTYSATLDHVFRSPRSMLIVPRDSLLANSEESQATAHAKGSAVVKLLFRTRDHSSALANA